GLVLEILQGFVHRFPHRREIVNHSLSPLTTTDASAGTDDHDRNRNLNGHLHPLRMFVDRHREDERALFDFPSIPTTGEKPHHQNPRKEVKQTAFHPPSPPFFAESGSSSRHQNLRKEIKQTATHPSSPPFFSGLGR